MSWQDGFQESARRAQAIMEDLRQERDDALKECTRIAAERDAAKREAKGWQERAHECEVDRDGNDEIYRLTAERDALAREYEKLRDELGSARGDAVRRGETILALQNKIANQRTEQALRHRAAERRERQEPTSAAGTGPVAVPDSTPQPLKTPGNIDEAGVSIKGLHDVVAKHSREIGTLQDECRTLRERVARLERQVDPASDGKTATIPGTSAGLL